VELLILLALDNRLAEEVDREVARDRLPGDRVQRFEGLDTLDRETLAHTALIVMPQTEWKAFCKKISERERPPVYLVTGDECATADVLNLGLFGELAGVAAFGAARLPGLARDIVQTYATLRHDSGEELAIDVGTYVTVDRVTEPPLVAWAVGPWAAVRRSLTAAGEEVRGWSPPANPFTHVSPAEWLDLYAHYTSGPKLEGWGATEEQAFRKRTNIGLPDAFKQRFEQYFLQPATASPRRPTLLLGETGSGKTLVARFLHRQLEETIGRRLPLRRVNCSALREMAEAELFGALRGAFTDATTTNPGKILASYGGTLFLDELGALPLSAQAKLLVFLDDGTVTPMGWAGPELRVPVQIVAATNDRLAARVARGEFRADLYYRFGRVITLPPLRQVKHDLPYLIDYFLQQEGVNPGKHVQGLSRAAYDKLARYDYPGNVRELEALLTQAVGQARQARRGVIAAADIVFGDSALPRKDAVVAFVVPPEGHPRKLLLLLWSASWGRWFLPSRTVEYDTFERCLQRELEERLGLEASMYTFGPLERFPTIRLIQFSRREQRVKLYEFRAFRVVLREARSFDDRPTVRWLTPEELVGPADEGRPLSETLLAGPFRDALDTILTGSSAPPGP